MFPLTHRSLDTLIATACRRTRRACGESVLYSALPNFSIPCRDPEACFAQPHRHDSPERQEAAKVPGGSRKTPSSILRAFMQAPTAWVKCIHPLAPFPNISQNACRLVERWTSRTLCSSRTRGDISLVALPLAASACTSNKAISSIDRDRQTPDEAASYAFRIT